MTAAASEPADGCVWEDALRDAEGLCMLRRDGLLHTAGMPVLLYAHVHALPDKQPQQDQHSRSNSHSSRRKTLHVDHTGGLCTRSQTIETHTPQPCTMQP